MLSEEVSEQWSKSLSLQKEEPSTWMKSLRSDAAASCSLSE